MCHANSSEDGESKDHLCIPDTRTSSQSSREEYCSLGWAWRSVLRIQVFNVSFRNETTTSISLICTLWPPLHRMTQPPFDEIEISTRERMVSIATWWPENTWTESDRVSYSRDCHSGSVPSPSSVFSISCAPFSLHLNNFKNETQRQTWHRKYRRCCYRISSWNRSIASFILYQLGRKHTDTE